MSAAALRARHAYAGAAVVIPAHNEAAKLPSCLRAVLTAALCAPVPVSIVVVLDAGDDDSAKLAGRYGPDVHFIRVDAPDAGTARAVGFAYARSLFADGGNCWYAVTEPGGRVGPAWLADQLQLDADVVLGANMGFSARAYWRVGGFRALAAGEDVDLAERFEAAGYTVHRDIEPEGFADGFGQLEKTRAGDCA